MTPNERKLNQALRMLADAGPREAPLEVEQQLIAAFRTRAQKRKTTRWWWTGSAVAAIAASVLLFAVARGPSKPVPPVLNDVHAPAEARATTPPQQLPVTKVGRARRRRRPMRETAEFYALPDADNAIPLEHATVVRVQMPMSDLRELGVEINEQRASDQVQADVLLGQDGIARAVRFVE